jgi:hypothetical protein
MFHLTVRDPPMFSVKHKNCALASCIKAANFVCRDVDIFQKPTTVLKEILYSLTLTAQKLQTLVFVNIMLFILHV